MTSSIRGGVVQDSRVPVQDSKSAVQDSAGTRPRYFVDHTFIQTYRYSNLTKPTLGTDAFAPPARTTECAQAARLPCGGLFSNPPFGAGSSCKPREPGLRLAAVRFSSVIKKNGEALKPASRADPNFPSLYEMKKLPKTFVQQKPLDARALVVDFLRSLLSLVNADL